MSKCMREYCANPSRGSYSLSIESNIAVWKARECIAHFFNIKDSSRICFTKNATEALNYAIKGVIKENQNILISKMEHNSVIRPLKKLEVEKKIKILTIKSNNFGEICFEDFKLKINENVKVVIITLASNVNGTIMPVEKIGNLCRSKGIILILDASQGAGYLNIDVEKMCIDIMAMPGHKALYGPQGTGILYVRESVDISTIIEGGTGTDSTNLMQPENYPDKFEAGTLNTPGIVGLHEGLKFINLSGREEIRLHKKMLTQRLFNELNNINLLKIYSSEKYLETGIVSFNIKDIDCQEVTYVFDKVYHIMARSGLHCSPYAHETIGTKNIGTVRISIGFFNTMKEIEYLLSSINEIVKSL